MTEPTPPPWISPALAEPEGLVGVGGSLDPMTLLRAYRDGVFPWFSDDDPVLWWSPDPRAVIELDGLHVSRSLARTIRSGRFRVTFDTAFAAVVRGCAITRPGETWVTPTMVDAYTALHARGHAHSAEVWLRDGVDDPPESVVDGDWTLAGGVYGVAVGTAFAGESMFHYATDASKVALAALVDRLRDRGFTLFDVQMRTEHTTRMGAVDIPRAEYLRRLAAAVRTTGVTFGPA